MQPLGIDYVLPLKWTHQQHRNGVAELTGYLHWLSGHAHIIVVDGSPEDLFARHHQFWGDRITHIRPDRSAFLNGKANGVHTGLRHATAEAVVIADDDVRYDADSLERTARLLDEADLIGPQNVFAPMPWHAAWDSARSLLNRAFVADYPGTFAIRRSTFHRMGGYSGDVLFENLELMRTVRAHGGRVLRPLDIYVARRPTSVDGFLSQRVRQAFDDLAQPWRLATFLPMIPLLGTSRRGRRIVAGALLTSVVVAEAGRRRAGGTAWFPRRVSLFAPLWVAERAVCSWISVGQWLTLGGVRYAGRRLAVAAHTNAALRREAEARRALVTASGTESVAMRPVAERLGGRSPTAAQRHRATFGLDLSTVDVRQAETPAQDKRAVGVGRHDGLARVNGFASTVHVHTHAPDDAPPAN